MEEDKEKKKNTKPKTTNIKNKKTVKNALAKSSIKGQTTKKTKKASTVKKKTKELEPKKEKITPLVKVKEVKKKDVKKKDKPLDKRVKRTVKAPNNIKRKIPKEEVQEEQNDNPEVLVNIVEYKKKLPESDEISIEKEKISNEIKKLEEKIFTDKEKKKIEKKKEKEEKKKKRKEKKLREKEEKKRLKEKQLKEKKETKELKKRKNKIELPKEWKTINSKNYNIEKNKVETPKTFKGKLRSSIFESIDEQELKEQKRKGKEKFKKNLIVLLIIVIIIGVAIFALLKYNEDLRKSLAVYDVYRIGDKVKLEDNSIWYVISDSDSKTESVRLLSDTILDYNKDGSINEYDKVTYNNNNTSDFDTSDKNCLGYYLNRKIKDMLEEKISSIQDVDLLSSEDFVRVRDRMNYGDEWMSSNNWLAGAKYPRWWIKSSRNNKVYVVTDKGTFYLVSAKSTQYMRLVIVMNKDDVVRIKENKKIVVDLINGLKK